MNSTERKQIEKFIRRARDQRNATNTNETFDYWQGVMEHYIEALKTGEENNERATILRG
jgi:hypothetical protein